MEKLMNQINSVCVYSASSTKIDPVYFTAAETLGRLLADHHIRLINGAGSIGLMRSVADAVLANGGEVTGVIPHFYGRAELAPYRLDGAWLKWNPCTNANRKWQI